MMGHGAGVDHQPIFGQQFLPFLVGVVGKDLGHPPFGLGNADVLFSSQRLLLYQAHLLRVRLTVVLIRHLGDPGAFLVISASVNTQMIRGLAS